ncbi:MAG TPA: hypothetical protein PKE37_15470 [Thiomonas arsenitoxydans]|uniref:hypothetical protein n=1 Tax=Thiomonas arsenitoxydans (strain DSM 22701 / CIP 110005 / 3As) TaxID=426114 RepID=UPI002BA5BB63|nr:hypothetical protein [Thiomonas arsenitoxydans]HML83154.1 hypothetical protein [Thiomonas arsenitoxydans]
MTSIALSALTFDLAGIVTLPLASGSDVTSMGRRVNRVATLDLGAAINDYGFTHADRTFEVSWRPRSAAALDVVAGLLQRHGRLRAAVAEGVFLVAPERLTRSGDGEARLTLLVLEKLSD